jgi:hypothetical protein
MQVINVTTLERTLAFVQLVTRHLTTTRSPNRISLSLNIADRVAEVGKCAVLKKLLKFLKNLVWLVHGGPHLKLLLRRTSFNLVGFQFSLTTLHFVTDINIEIILIFSLCKLNRIVKNCVHLSSLSRVTEPTLTTFTTLSLFYRC